jgi:hypothetical protein
MVLGTFITGVVLQLFAMVPRSLTALAALHWQQSRRGHVIELRMHHDETHMWPQGSLQ